MSQNFCPISVFSLYEYKLNKGRHVKEKRPLPDCLFTQVQMAPATFSISGAFFQLMSGLRVISVQIGNFENCLKKHESVSVGSSHLEKRFLSLLHWNSCQCAFYRALIRSWMTHPHPNILLC